MSSEFSSWKVSRESVLEIEKLIVSRFIFYYLERFDEINSSSRRMMGIQWKNIENREIRDANRKYL